MYFFVKLSAKPAGKTAQREPEMDGLSMIRRFFRFQPSVTRYFFGGEGRGVGQCVSFDREWKAKDRRQASMTTLCFWFAKE